MIFRKTFWIVIACVAPRASHLVRVRGLKQTKTKYYQTFFQFIRFGLVGMVSTFTHIGTLAFLVELFSFPPIPASTLGFILAVTISYILNHRFTFKAQESHSIYFPRYSMVCIVGLFLNTGIMFLTVQVLEWWYLIGQICTLTIVPISNFTLNRFWTFSQERRGLLKNCRTASELIRR